MKILKDFSIYTIVGIVSSGVPFLLLPILTRYLSPEDYGILSLFNAYVTLLIPIIGLSAMSLVNVDFFKLNNSQLTHLISSLIIIPLSGLGILLCIFFLLRDMIGDLLGITGIWLTIIPVVCFFSVVNESFQSFLINQKKAVTYSFTSVGKVALEVSMTLLFVAFLELGWKGRVSSVFITTFTMCIVGMLYFYRSGLLVASIKRKLIFDGLAFGLPLIPHQIGKFVINQSDRIFISKMISIQETGIYSVGYLIGSIILIVSGAALKVYSPFLHERLNNISFPKKIEIVRFSYLFVGGLLVVVLLLNMLAPLLFEYFLDRAYMGGMVYVIWISISYLLWGVYLVFAGYIFYLKRTGIFTILSLVNVVVNLIGNYYLITHFGAIGAAYSTALSFALVAIAMILISNRLYPMPWFNFKEILSVRN